MFAYHSLAFILTHKAPADIKQPLEGTWSYSLRDVDKHSIASLIGSDEPMTFLAAEGMHLAFVSGTTASPLWPKSSKRHQYDTFLKLPPFSFFIYAQFKKVDLQVVF